MATTATSQERQQTTSPSPMAVDVIRYVYLAREFERRGDHVSARRWQAKADRWLRQQDGVAESEIHEGAA